MAKTKHGLHPQLSALHLPPDVSRARAGEEAQWVPPGSGSHVCTCVRSSRGPLKSWGRFRVGGAEAKVLWGVVLACFL